MTPPEPAHYPLLRVIRAAAAVLFFLPAAAVFLLLAALVCVSPSLRPVTEPALDGFWRAYARIPGPPRPLPVPPHGPQDAPHFYTGPPVLYRQPLQNYLQQQQRSDEMMRSMHEQFLRDAEAAGLTVTQIDSDAFLVAREARDDRRR